jgi:DNA-binding transcriptional LysR family regulator
MDWDKLRIFHAVASAGSFTHAGQMLTLSQSAVSRQISALEEEITTPLFQRHARGLTLTDEGEMLYAAVSDVLNRLAQAEEALKNVREAPRGALKITSSHGIGTYWLVPRMDDFLKEYPEVEVHLVMEDREPRGRYRHSHAGAGAGGFDPAQALHRALSHVRDEGLPGGVRHAQDAGRHRRPHHHRLWRDGGAGDPRDQLAPGADPPAAGRKKTDAGAPPAPAFFSCAVAQVSRALSSRGPRSILITTLSAGRPSCAWTIFARPTM